MKLSLDIVVDCIVRLRIRCDGQVVWYILTDFWFMQRLCGTFPHSCRTFYSLHSSLKVRSKEK